MWAQPKPAGWPLGARIPAISGQVVDAFTGKPIANIDVTLRATSGTGSFGDGSGVDPLRYENDRTPKTGRFSFRKSLETSVAKPLTSLHSYWLSVNRAFLPVASLLNKLGYEATMDTTAEEFSWDIARDPLFNGGIARAGDQAYFPMAVQFVHPCSQMWNANCLSFSDTRDVRIPLIPVLDDPGECIRILDPDLREKCRQLNTYRAAFRHVETIAQVRADKEWCRKVDGGPLTQACLESLELYIANPHAFKNRLPLHMETDPIEQVLILTPIEGMFVIRSTISSLNPFRETAAYTVCYSVDHVWQSDAACVTLWRAAGEKDRQAAATVGTPTGYTKGAERTEVVEGNSITTLDLPMTYTAVWRSGAQVVKIIFYNAAAHSALGHERALAATAPPESRRELIRRYLLKYPSGE